MEIEVKTYHERTHLLKAHLTDSCLTIFDSYKIKEKLIMESALNAVFEKYPEYLIIQKRDLNGMIAEWRVHNLLYKLGIFRKHTKSVDFEYPQKRILSFLYKTISFFYFWN